jgi:hypothetical protein
VRAAKVRRKVVRPVVTPKVARRATLAAVQARTAVDASVC